MGLAIQRGAKWGVAEQGHATASSVTAYLLILEKREAVAWVLRESRMTFPPTARREVSGLSVGDELFMLTTRGSWHNPTRDRTMVIG
jgi:hypothetical protein